MNIDNRRQLENTRTKLHELEQQYAKTDFGETIMHKMDIEAIYEHGTLKLPVALPLQEGQKVSITIHPTDSAVKRLTGLIQWQGSQEDLDHLILSDDNDPLEASWSA